MGQCEAERTAQMPSYGIDVCKVDRASKPAASRAQIKNEKQSRVIKG